MGYFKKLDQADAIRGVNASIDRLSEVLPKLDYFIEALEQLRDTMESINVMAKDGMPLLDFEERAKLNEYLEARADLDSRATEEEAV